MTISELLQYCMAKPGAEQSVHSDWKATQIKVSDVLFALIVLFLVLGMTHTSFFGLFGG